MLISSTIKLRALEPEDLELMYAWENNPDVWKVSNTLSPFSRFILKQYLENAHQDIYEAKQLRLMIDLRGDTNGLILETVGSVDLFDFDPFHMRAGVGILINKLEYRNKGYAKEALRLLIEYCFEHLHIHQLYCNILSENESSIKLFKQAGFAQCGMKKQWIKTKNGWADELMLQLINNNRL